MQIPCSVDTTKVVQQQQPASGDTSAAAEAPPTDPEAPPPPWLNKQHDTTIVSVEQLLANKIEQEEVLSQIPQREISLKL